MADNRNNTKTADSNKSNNKGTKTKNSKSKDNVKIENSFDIIERASLDNESLLINIDDEQGEGSEVEVLESQPGGKPQTELVPVTKKRRAPRKPCGCPKPLKKSIIRRMCRIPSADNSVRTASRDAEIIYTNSQFGRSVETCNCSSCQICSLTPRCRKRAKPVSKVAKKSKSKPKRSMPAVKRRTAAKIGRPRNVTSARRSTASVRRSAPKPIIDLDPIGTLPSPSERSGQLRQCLCTELNGQVYKLMDLPSSIDASTALMLSMRRQELKRLSKPRLNTKRQVGKRSTSCRKITKRKHN